MRRRCSTWRSTSPPSPDPTAAPLGGIDGDLGRLDRNPYRGARVQAKLAHGSGRDLRYERHRALDAHADPFAMQVDVLGHALPHVSRRALGPGEIESHCSRMDDGEDIALACVRSG